MGLPPIVYSHCPGCGLVTAPAWQLRDGDPPAAVPVEVGCGNCGHRYVVNDVGGLHTALDAVVWHQQCGTAVACPAVADVVRCTQRGPDVTASHGCGDLIPGPAAGGPPPPAGADLAGQSVPAPWRIDRLASRRPVDPWAAVTGETNTRRAKRP